MLSNKRPYDAVHLNHAVRCDTARSGVRLVRRRQIRVRPNKPSTAVRTRGRIVPSLININNNNKCVLHRP